MNHFKIFVVKGKISIYLATKYKDNIISISTTSLNKECLIINLIKNLTKLNYFSYKLILLFVIFLTACTLNKQLTIKDNLKNNPLWINHYQKITKIMQFQARGTLIYINAYNKIYANFFWKQKKPMNYYLILTNAFGTTELALHVTPYVTQLIDKRGKKYINNTSLIKIIHQLTGIDIPIQNLSYWLIGLPTNGVLFTLNKNGLLKTIKYKQDSKIWHLQYLRYHQNDQLKLPNLIELTQDRQYIKFKIDSWKLNK